MIDLTMLSESVLIYFKTLLMEELATLCLLPAGSQNACPSLLMAGATCTPIDTCGSSHQNTTLITTKASVATRKYSWWKIYDSEALCLCGETFIYLS